MIALRILILFCMSLASVAQASVWTATRSWSMDWESEFSRWIKVLPLDIFSNPSSRYSGIATDCADAAYALRIIFAYENGLPVRFQDRKDLSNSTDRFDEVRDEQQRLKKFIRFVSLQTGTETLSYDSYPVRIDRQFVRPGTMFLHAASGSDVPVTYRSGHVYYLQSVGENGLIKYISSTVPIAVRALSARYGILFAPQETDSGYRAWKWPDSKERPGHSDEQFKIGGWRAKAYGDARIWTSWQEAVQARLRTRRMTANEEFQSASLNLKAALYERSVAVIEGWNFYRQNYQSGSCMDGSDYEDHSTPTRDVKIQLELRKFQKAAQKYLQATNRPLDSGLRGIYREFKMEVIAGKVVNFEQLWKAFMTETALQISEPEHAPDVRWGLKDQGRWVCPDRKKQYKGGEN